MIKKVVFLVSIIMGFVVMSCEHNITDPGKSGLGVRFSLGKTGHSNPGLDLLNRALKNHQLNPHQLLKTTGFDELDLICLDMTRFSNIQDFFTYWDSSSKGGQLLDMSLWDSTKDVWDNYVLLLKKYPGDAYDYMGDYSFSISDSTAKGTVYLNPGLNYFLYALRKGGKSGTWPGETWAIISNDSSNTVNLNYTNLPPDYPSSPHPPNYQTGVFTNVILKWVCTDPDFDPIRYDVHFGTYLSQIIDSNLAVSQYNPGILQPNTTYYWYVVARDDHGNSTIGDQWQFTTGTSK